MSIESDFKALVEATTPKIKAKLREAMVLLREAEQISEDTGVPFRSSISPLSQEYRPVAYDAIQEKYTAELEADDNGHEDLDSHDLFCNITGDYAGECAGWQHSAVCY